MEFQEVVHKRRMVRNFDPDRPVRREVVERIIDNARRAPSAGHTQGWAFLVLEGPRTARFWDAMYPPEKRAGFAYPGLFHAPLIIVPLACKRDYIERYAEPDKGWTDRDESRWPTPYWEVDTAFASMLVLLTAVNEGLGALFFGIYDIASFRAAFGVPDTHHPIGAIAVGHARPDPPSPSLKRGRRSVEEVVHYGSWRSPDSPGAMAQAQRTRNVAASEGLFTETMLSVS